MMLSVGTLTALLVSRNKLIEDLLAELPETESQFKKGLSMREKSFAKDKDIWDKERRSNAKAKRL